MMVVRDAPPNAPRRTSRLLARARRLLPGRRFKLGVRTPLYHPDFPFILLWSQKAGCTTVVKWFFDQVGLLEEARAYAPWVHFYEGRVYKRRKGYRQETRAAMLSGRYRVVKVVRDPFRRAASSFLTLADRASLRADHWSVRYWAQAGEWLERRGLDSSAGLSFLDHLDHVAERTLTRFNAVDLHVAQQYLPREEDVVHECVPIERFAAWATAEASRRGLKASDFCVIARSSHHHRTDPERTALLGEQPEACPIRAGMFSDNRFPDGNSLINPRSLPKLHAAYAADVAAYGHLYGIEPRR